MRVCYVVFAANVCNYFELRKNHAKKSFKKNIYLCFMSNFKSIVSLVLVLLLGTFFYQTYWVWRYYQEQSSKLELDILSAMRSANDQLIFQKGEQIAIDDLISIDFYNYNDLLQGELMQRDLIFESVIEIVDTRTDKILGCIPDTLITRKNSEYKDFSYYFDLNHLYACKLWVKDSNIFLLKQISGILLASFLMMIALIISYIYLLRIILRQKNIDEIKSDFVNNMTHELKTPISVAYAATDALLNHGMMDEKEKRTVYLNASKKQLEHLSGLVEQILTMSVEERKNMKLNFSEIRLTEVFEQLKQQHSLNAPKPMEIQIDMESEDIIIPADKTHFYNILSNLIENAVKYSGESVKIILSATQNENQTCIRVKDNGIGIPASSLSKIFDRFYRVPKGDIHDVKGYGLGLYYVKTIVEKHGWTIEVQSKEGEGTEFLIRWKKK